MRRFLRVSTTLVRCFSIAEFPSIEPANAVAEILDHADSSGVSWRRKFRDFIDFLTERCSDSERPALLGGSADSDKQTG
jgi:hypothetical protein